MARRFGRFHDQVIAAGRVQYNPQLRGLNALLQAAIDNRLQSLQVASGNARLAQDTFHGEPAQIQQVFNNAANQTAAQRGLSTTALGALGGTADPFRAAAAVENASQDTQAAQAQAAAQTDAVNRRDSAVQGAMYARAAADTQFQRDATKILDQKQGVLGDLGTYRSSLFNQLVEADRKLRHDTNMTNKRLETTATQGRLNRQNQRQIAQGHDTTSRQNAITRANRPGAAGTPKRGLGSLKPLAEQKIIDNIHQASTYISRLSGDGMNYGQIRQHLIAGDTLGSDVPIPQIGPNGRPMTDKKGNPVYQTDAQGNVKTRQEKLTLPKTDSLYVDVAIEIAKDGHLSPGTVRKLHTIGVHVPSAWRPPRMPSRRTSSTERGIAGGQLAGPPAPGA